MTFFEKATPIPFNFGVISPYTSLKDSNLSTHLGNGKLRRWQVKLHSGTKTILITFGWDPTLCGTIVWIWYLWWIQEPPGCSLISFISSYPGCAKPFLWKIVRLRNTENIPALFSLCHLTVCIENEWMFLGNNLYFTWKGLYRLQEVCTSSSVALHLVLCLIFPFLSYHYLKNSVLHLLFFLYELNPPSQ